jgi:guanine nucleotide-binding protein G(i) subunit alpha
MILFLNKVDLFTYKLWRIPYRIPGVRNDDFCGPFAEDPDANKNEVIEAATKHTLDKFLQVKRDTEKEIYHHVTCATDTKNIEVVFNASKDIILRANLVESGFMQ